MGTNITHKFYIGDVLDALRSLPDESVHCVVTSPPYWGLRDYGIEGQLGLEKTPEEYVGKMVEVFREVWRVLRDDGTLWLNLGDSYFVGTGGNNSQKAKVGNTKRGIQGRAPIPKGYKRKDLVGIPWRVALALQADGWYLRSDIIWHKPNPMPESVTDRLTRAHEYIFLLSKSAQYYYDADAVRENADWERWGDQTTRKRNPGKLSWMPDRNKQELCKRTTRNRRSVWTIPTKPFKDAHFAVMPQALVEPCIKAGTSEYGCCPKCGAPWERVVKKAEVPREAYVERSKMQPGNTSDTSWLKIPGSRRHLIRPPQVIGWRPTCSCGVEETIPCVILDPFGGAGTTNLVAAKLGRASIYIDLNPEYAEMAIRRLQASNKNNLFEGHVVETINIYPAVTQELAR